MILMLISVAVSLGLPTLSQASAPAYVPRAMTYSAESAQIIRLEFGQSVAVKKLSKIEKTAIKLTKLVN